LHELATNAAKHGAMTTDSGAVSVRWSLDATSSEPAIIFRWHERGGPPATPPETQGLRHRSARAGRSNHRRPSAF
jgi:two-component sensor histidine kinase